MGHALEGKTDVLKTVDHMGNLILCSYTYAPSVRMGIVAKIFLNDLRLPFLKTALLTYLGAFVLFFLGGLAIKMTAAPLVSELEKNAENWKSRTKISISLRPRTTSLNCITGSISISRWHTESFSKNGKTATLH